MKLAISACLDNHNVTFSASNNNDDFIRKNLSKYFDFIHFCPEYPILGAPRETLRLIDFDGELKAISNKTNQDFTPKLKIESLKIVQTIKETRDIFGVILKSKSPTCGLERVRVYEQNGMSKPSNGIGVLAKELKNAFPLLPIEENNRLLDPWLRENFIMQVFAFSDFENFKNNKPTMNKLVEFHTSYKYLIMSKSTVAYKKLGNIVANREKKDFEKLLLEYEIDFKTLLHLKSSIKKTINVLEHCYGYVKNYISVDEKESFFESLELFKNKIVPLITPIMLLEMFAKKHSCKYILNQKFLSPYPKALALRSDLNSLK